MGGAGTGKTTNLLLELEKHLATHPLCTGQRVLALTFMHGSRHRLAERLAKSSARRHSECMTLDRFAWEICRRWRSRLRAGGFVPLELDAPDYDATCEAAGQLLASSDVARWVAARFPVIVLDEFQDCDLVRLALAQRLHGRVTMLVAADDFQNLKSTEESPSVAWLRSLNVCEELTLNRRTAVVELIAAAQALRASAPLVAGANPSFKLMNVQSAPQAAAFISLTMVPAAGKDVVLLSAAKPGKSPWVDEVIELVRTKQYGKPRKVGPVPIKWETTADGLAETIIAALGIADGNGRLGVAAILALPRSPVATRLNRWVEHQRRVLGCTEFEADDVRSQVKRAAQHVRSFGALPQGGRRAMTIHHAKNREFPVVIVLWPFQVQNDAMLARRLLYNAITRAKRRAIVIVHDPQKNRLRAPPFA